MAQAVKNSPAMQETQVQSLGQEDPWKKGTATHSSILAWRIPWTEEPGRLHTVHAVTKSQDTTKRLSTAYAIKKPGLDYTVMWGNMEGAERMRHKT